MASSVPAKTPSGRSIEANPRGIPKAPFVHDVVEHIGGQDADTDKPLRDFQEMAAKYRFMEMSTEQRRRSLEEKIPDIRKTLAMVQFLKSRREKAAGQGDEDELEDEDAAEAEKGPLRTTFELNDTLYAEAELEDSDTVYLWLGANTMLSYPLDQAIELLTSKLRAAETSLKNAIEDLEYLREQITVMDVNTARLWNWDVKRRRERRERGELEDEKKKEERD